MKKFIVVVAAILVLGLYAEVSSQEHPRPEALMLGVLQDIDNHDFGVPLGTRDSPGCRMFWKMSSYQGVQKRYEEVLAPQIAKEKKAEQRAKLKKLKYKKPQIGDAYLIRLLAERIEGSAERAMELLQAELEREGKLGCGGRELSDDIVISFTRAAMPERAPAQSLSRKK